MRCVFLLIYAIVCGMEIFDNILNEFHIENAYESWTEYRQYLTEWILASAEQIKNSIPEEENASPLRILIVGIGAGNDIDLRALLKRGYELELLDMDESAVEEAIKRYQISPSDPVKIRIHSLTGITQKDISAFFYKMYLFMIQERHAMTERRFMEYALREESVLLQKIEEETKKLPDIIPQASADLVIAVGLFSQLFTLLSYAYQVLLSNASEAFFHGQMPEKDLFHERLMETDNRLIPELMQGLFQAARYGILLGNEWDPENPVEGAQQSLSFARDYGKKKMARIEESTKVWPFSPETGKQYIMLLQKITKIKTEKEQR